MAKVVSASAFEYLLVELMKDVFHEREGVSFEDAVANVDAMGFEVGKKLVNRCSKAQTRLKSDLDVVKFVCKDFWIYTFGKQVNKLKTNHRGVFELYDDKFRLLINFSPTQGMDSSTFKKYAQRYLTFVAGVLRGAFYSLGRDCVVTPTVSKPPACSFQCQIVGMTTGSSQAAVNSTQNAE